MKVSLYLLCLYFLGFPRYEIFDYWDNWYNYVKRRQLISLTFQGISGCKHSVILFFTFWVRCCAGKFCEYIVVLRPSEKFSSSSKTSKGIFEPSEFRARFLNFNFRAERVRARIFRALKDSEQNSSEHEHIFEFKFRAFLAKSSEQKIFFRAKLNFYPKSN